MKPQCPRISMRLWSAHIRSSHAAALAGALMLLGSTIVAAAALEVCPVGCSFESIQSAVNAAHSGDVINIAQGRYVENVSIAGKSLQLVGAGNGRTVVDGAWRGSVFTLGTGTDSPSESIEIANLSVTHGMATSGGGVRVLAGAFLSLQGVIVVSNVAHKNGAGIYINTSNAPATVIEGCAIDNNKIDDDTTYTTGGGIAVFGSTVLIDRSTITRNIVPLAGGGVAFTAGQMPAGQLTITASSIVDNQTQQSLLNGIYVGGGGGVYFDAPSAGSLTISNSDISRNSSARNAGGVEAFGQTTITDSVIGRNTAAVEGGGIDTGGSGRSLTLNRDYLIQNTAIAAGGIGNGGSPLFITHTTIQDNVPDNCEGTGCP